jgi:hypothetical protein
MSQLELAFKAGVSRFRLYLIEKGYTKATPEEEAKIQRALDKKSQSMAAEVDSHE